MSRVLHWVRLLVALMIGAVLLLFSINNAETVTLTLWPLPYEMALPAFLIAVLSLVVGLFLGALGTYISLHHWKTRARSAERSVKTHEEKLQAARAERRSKESAVDANQDVIDADEIRLLTGTDKA